jgi:hypothetical protein
MSDYRHGASQVVRRQQGEDEVGDGVQVEQGGGARVVHVPHRILTLKLYWYNSIVLNICNIRIPTKSEAITVDQWNETKRGENFKF